MREDANSLKSSYKTIWNCKYEGSSKAHGKHIIRKI